jgi:hypothetical protein
MQTSNGTVGEWCSITDAAHQFGVSPDTVKRRIKRGELPTRKDQTQTGWRWLVYVAVAPAGGADAAPAAPADGALTARAAPADVALPAPAAPTAEVHRLEQLVASQEATIAEQRVELEARRREVQELIVLLERAQRLALPAPREETPSAETLESLERSRPWWERWRWWRW